MWRGDRATQNAVNRMLNLAPGFLPVLSTEMSAVTKGDPDVFWHNANREVHRRPARTGRSTQIPLHQCARDAPRTEE